MLESYAAKQQAFYGLDISRMSSVFLSQILIKDAQRYYNVFSILDEVKYLEGVWKGTLTKTAVPFRRGQLKGYMKKHYTEARYFVKNIGAHFGMEHGGNKRLEEVFEKANRLNKSGCIDDEYIGFVANEITFNCYKERAKAKRLTGEWIVFENHNNMNYYLTLATHNEDEAGIFKRIEMAIGMNFPFLKRNSEGKPIGV